MPLISIADLQCSGDTAGRSYREVNNAKMHKYAVGDLVKLTDGGMGIVSKLTRDCDGTPLYSLEIHGYSEESLYR